MRENQSESPRSYTVPGAKLTSYTGIYQVKTDTEPNSRHMRSPRGHLHIKAGLQRSPRPENSCTKGVNCGPQHENPVSIARSRSMDSMVCTMGPPRQPDQIIQWQANARTKVGPRQWSLKACTLGSLGRSPRKKYHRLTVGSTEVASHNFASFISSQLRRGSLISCQTATRELLQIHASIAGRKTPCFVCRKNKNTCGIRFEVESNLIGIELIGI